MSGDFVEIKGNPKGITIVLDAGWNFEQVKQNIYNKLQRGRSFFAGGTAHLEISGGILSKNEHEELKSLLQEFEMTLKEKIPDTQLPAPHRGKVLLLKRTIRSGQRISHRGTIVVLGDINAGGEVVATGDILVMGTLRGMAHAGARGDDKAVVAAFRLKPTQLRIAHIISRPPEEKTEEVPTVPEIAHLKDDLIIIEPLNSSVNFSLTN